MSQDPHARNSSSAMTVPKFEREAILGSTACRLRMHRPRMPCAQTKREIILDSKRGCKPGPFIGHERRGSRRSLHSLERSCQCQILVNSCCITSARHSQRADPPYVTDPRPNYRGIRLPGRRRKRLDVLDVRESENKSLLFVCCTWHPEAGAYESLHAVEPSIASLSNFGTVMALDEFRAWGSCDILP